MEYRKFKCFVHAPIKEDLVNFEFAGIPTQAELYQHIHPIIEKFGLDFDDVRLLNNIVDIHNRVISFNNLDYGFDRKKIEVVYTIGSFDHLDCSIDFNTYYIPKKVMVAASTHKVTDLMERFDMYYCSKDPDLNFYAQSLPFTKSINIV
jgi:hypothetical protein